MRNKIVNVQDNLVSMLRVENIDYISLTDLVRYKNPNNLNDGVIK